MIKEVPLTRAKRCLSAGHGCAEDGDPLANVVVEPAPLAASEGITFAGDFISNSVAAVHVAADLRLLDHTRNRAGLRRGLLLSRSRALLGGRRGRDKED